MTSLLWGWWPSPRISHNRSWAPAARPTSVLKFRPGALHAEWVPAEGRVVSPAKVKADTGRRARRASLPPRLRGGRPDSGEGSQGTRERYRDAS